MATADSQATSLILEQSLAAWCQWIHNQAVLAKNASPADARSFDGQPTTWRNYCGALELALVEAAIGAGVFGVEE